MMHTIADAAHAGRSAPTRLLMLPAAYSGPTWYRLWENFLDARLTPHPTLGGHVR